VAVGLLADGAAAGDDVLVEVPLDPHAAATSMTPTTAASLHQGHLPNADPIMA
jgi:hypothetical protein